MPLDEPHWWYEAGSRVPWQVRALRPMSHIYSVMAERRFRGAAPYRARIPVICVGNLTAGGTGKTPLSVMIGRRLIAMGERPVFLTRGYGGRLSGPVLVDKQKHTARDVGDEPLLLARVAPVVVARDRKAGAQAIEGGAAPASVIVMDDGLQNPALKKDLTIAVIDALRGVGNGEVIPAGPLRAPLDFQLAMTDCIVANGQGTEETVALAQRFKREFPGPVLCASTGPAGDVVWIKGARLVAYAGIGHPERFFKLLAALGATLAETVVFPDHHTFSEADSERLLAFAAANDALLVTTEKDLVRLASATGKRAQLAVASRTLPIAMNFVPQESDRLAALLEAAFKTGRGK